MPYGTPSNPVGGTVITVVYAVANLLDPIRWLRLMSGNADPPGSSYVVVSESTTSTSWKKVPGDALATDAVVANLGYTPVNKAGDTMSGTLTARGVVASVDGVNAGPGGFNTTGPYTGGTQLLGNMQVRGLVAGVDGLQAGAGGIVTSGPIQPASYTGGSATAGTPSVRGLVVGVDGVNVAGGISVGANGVSSSGPVTSNGSATITAATIGSQSVAFATNATNATNATSASNATQLGGKTPTATPTADAIPLADAAGKLDAWVTPTSAAPVPSGLIAFIADGNLPTGWSFYAAANGRVIVGAGSAGVTNNQTFTVGQSYGNNWGHADTVNIQHAHSISAQHSHGAAGLGVTGATGASSDINGLAAAGGVNLNTTGHTHGVGTLDVTGATDPGTSSGTDNGGSTSLATAGVVWIPPSHALNAIRKN